MKNWLDKYEYGGQAGYTDVPFNYNSAWGGQFQLGGNVMPGAVGFTYARTKGIPSNGPYAKKTKASAQNGNVTSSDDEIDYKELQAKNLEESVNFLKDWYTNRATLPQFKDVSERRLKVLEQPIKTRYVDPQIMSARGFAGAYNPTNKFLSIVDTDPSLGDFPEYSKFIEYSTGSPVVTHELFHKLHYEAPQFTDVVPEKITEKIPGYPELTSPEYVNLRTGKLKMGPKNASAFYPEMEAITGMLRQAETIDPIKPVTADDVSSYIKKYDKYSRDTKMKDLEVDKVQEFHRGRLIKQLFDVMGNDPERIAAYLNSVAKNDNNNKTQITAQKGEIIKQDSTDYQTLPEVSISPMVDPEVEQARQSMFDFYSNRPANLSGGVASEAVQNVKIKEIPTKRLQKLNAYGLYFPKTNTIGYSNETITPEGYSENPYDELKTIQHEIGHSVFESLPENEQEIIRESIISPKEFRQRWPKGEISRSWSKYVTKPTEFYTRRNKMFDIFEIDGSQPITEDKAQEMIDFRRFMSSTASPEEKEELLKKHPNLNKYKENYENSPVKGEIIDFMNSIKNDVPTYKRVFNEVTAVPGEQVPVAQNGMTYYQHGLDWKPKSISRDGSDIPKNQNAKYQVPSFTMPRAASESTATMFFDPVTKRMVSTATTGQKKKDVAASTKDMGKARKFEKEEEKKRVAERKSAVAAKDKGQAFTLPSGETKKYEDMDVREKMYVSGKALEQRGRFNENEEAWYDDYANPLNWITEAAGALGTAPYEAREYDSNLPYVSAVVNPLFQGALGFDPLGSALKLPGKVAQSMESGLLSNAYKLNPWAFKPNPEAYYRGIGRTGLDDAMESGVLRTANKTGNYGEDLYMTPDFKMAKGNYSVDQPTYKGDPFGEADDWEKILPVDARSYIAEIPKTSLTNARGIGTPVVVNEGSIPLNDVKLYKQDWLRGYKEVPKSTPISSNISDKDKLLSIVKEKYPSWFMKESPKTKLTDISAQKESAEFLKNFLKDPSKQSLYTPVDLKIPAYGETNLGLNPHLEGGRSIRTIDEGSGLFQKKADKFEEGYNLYDILNTTQYHMRKNKEGGVIKDDMGQWAHPGEVTEIGSNQITMQGVPYPVLGVSDEGDTQMMYPEQEYKFKGKKVTEYPMAQDGVKKKKSKTLPPVYVNDPNDPRLKLYTDSLSTFKKSQNPWFWEGTKITSKEDYEKKLAEQRKFPSWAFDEDQYKKDKKKGKFKDFNDYVYDVALANKPGSREESAYQRNVGKDFEELETPIEKKLPDGRIKLYHTKYKGKLDESSYTIYDPVTGSSSGYSNNTFLGLYNPNIKPIGHIYRAFDKPHNAGSMYISSEDSEYINKVLKNKSKKKKDYIDYTYGAVDNEIYKEPVQPVIYDKKKYNPNDPRLQQLQESFNRFHSGITQKAKPQAPKPEEPKLKRKVSKMEPISTQSSYTPSLRMPNIPNVELPGIQMGDYEVSYYSPESKDWANRRFTSQEESDRFAQEMSQRGYPGSYGNVTQTKKTNKKSTGGWLDKYDDGGTLGEDDKYQIQRGDTLSTIAKQYNVPLATLANANQLQNPNLIKAGKELVIPKKYDRELKFEEIPTTDNKKIVIDNFSPHYDYIIEGNKTYYKTKGGKTWADISDNTNARKNLLKFIDKNNYWAGYTSGEKEELYPTTPSKVSIGMPSARDLARQMTSSTDNTFVKKPQKQLTTKPIKTPSEKQPIKKVIKQDPNFFSGVMDNLAANVTNVGKKFSDVKTQIENTVTDIKNSVESEVNGAIQTVEDLYQTGINGIKRKYATHTGEDDDVRVVDKTKKSDKPMTLAEYYNNKSVGEISAVIDVPDGSGRQFKQQVLPTSNIKFGFRNRGEYKDINTDGIEITTFNPFTKDPLPDNTSVLAIDKEGNLHTGTYKDFKGKPGYLFSKTFKNNIVDFAESGGKNEYVDGAKSGNPKYKQPKIKVLNDQGKLVDGSLNVLVKGDDKKEFYGSIQGGRVLFVNPTTKEQYLVSGSVDHIKKKFRELKGNNKYLEAYTLDNGTYSRGLSYKDKKLTASRLKSYDLENTGGGNGLYITEYKQPMNKYKEDYIQTPNVRTEKDESYKKGHKLRNEIKNVVLHHTAYTNPKTNEEEVKKQYMTPGANTSHVVIEEDGKRVVYASPEQVTFHAGKSKWNNRENVNDFSIGVEFQGDTNRSPLTQAQIESFVEYYAPIAKKYGLSLKDVITHQMIAPERKPDITNKEYKRILDYMKSKGFK